MSLLQSKPAAGLAKPAGSLSSTMLARKGDARPGQRYMPEPGLEIPERTRVIKFGADMLAPNHAPVAATAAVDVFEPFTDALDFPAYEPAHDDAPGTQYVPLATTPLAPPAVRPSLVAPAPALNDEEIWQPLAIALPARSRKSAFTLRLDSDRHLRLRLLSAHQHRSAQQIVIEAVDRLLADVFDPLMASGRLSATLPDKEG